MTRTSGDWDHVAAPNTGQGVGSVGACDRHGNRLWGVRDRHRDRLWGNVDAEERKRLPSLLLEGLLTASRETCALKLVGQEAEYMSLHCRILGIKKWGIFGAPGKATGTDSGASRTTKWCVWDCPGAVGQSGHGGA